MKNMIKIDKLKSLYVFVLIFIKAPNVFSDNNFYLQATTQVAATNFDYVSTYYYNSSIEGFYNFESSPFIIGGGFGQIYGTTAMYFFTPNFYAAFNGGMDINEFTFTPGFSTNPDTPIANRKYNNPGPNIGFSVGINF